LDEDPEPAFASTTHYVVVDPRGNIVSCTQSTSLHFGAGVIAPGTGVVMNDSMSNFGVVSDHGSNLIAPGKRARSTTSPSIVFRDGRPVLAIGVPGAQRIPIAMLQVLLDVLAFKRPLAEAIGDTRLHLLTPESSRDADNVWEMEKSYPAADVRGLGALGWKITLVEPAGTGRHFGGVNAIAIGADGTLTGYADPRRTNAAAGF
jgi:gamma-glutamyltranspeptidase/glutathione hydrolase